MKSVSDSSRRVDSRVFPFCTLPFGKPFRRAALAQRPELAEGLWALSLSKRHFSFLTLHYRFARWSRDCGITAKKCMTASEGDFEGRENSSIHARKNAKLT
jgi:hypothetical protein